MTAAEAPLGLDEVAKADILVQLERNDATATAAMVRFAGGQLIGRATLANQVPDRLDEVAQGLELLGYRVVPVEKTTE